MLPAYQFGFRRRLGTADLLTLLQHKWSSTIANRGSVHTLAVDIAGAFDKVSHEGALAKAQACGISGTLHTWLQGYLSNRSLRAVRTGVGIIPRKSRSPQGSIRGPMLFVLYVNNCEDCLSGGSSLAVFTDDTTIYKCSSSGDSIQNPSSNLQQAVDAVAAWGSSWKIQFEPTESQALTLSNHRPPIALPSI